MTQQTVLVVEDNALNAKLMHDLLDYKGFRVIQAADAEHGIELAKSEHPDLILMDIHLPGMGGREALKVLRSDAATATIPIIAVTASVMPEESEQILAAGFDDFQGKPISVTELMAKINAQIGPRNPT